MFLCMAEVEEDIFRGEDEGYMERGALGDRVRPRASEASKWGFYCVERGEGKRMRLGERRECVDREIVSKEYSQ